MNIDVTRDALISLYGKQATGLIIFRQGAGGGSVDTNKTALDPNDACRGSKVQCAIRRLALTMMGVIHQNSALVVVVLLLLATQTVFSCI